MASPRCSTVSGFHRSRKRKTSLSTAWSAMNPWLQLTARKRFHFRVMFAIGYLRLAAAAFFAASRWTLYAIATACLCGLPAPISRLRFSVNAFSDADFFSGIVLLYRCCVELFKLLVCCFNCFAFRVEYTNCSVWCKQSKFTASLLKNLKLRSWIRLD